MANKEEIGLDFQPSTIETIDTAFLKYVQSLNLHSQTNKGFAPVPIIWVGAERTYQLKNDLTLRDSEGLLKIPLITVERKDIVKDASKSLLPANVPDVGTGGLIPVRRRIMQDKTNTFISAQNVKKSGVDSDVGQSQQKIPFHRVKSQAPIASMFDVRPRASKAKVVYETTYVPIPVYVTVKYEVHLRTEYQQQMNTLLSPFIAAHSPMGRNHKYFTISHDNHLFEAFIDGTFSNDNNAATLNEEERIFNSVINIEVLGYIIGGAENEEANLARKVESIVEVKVPRERVIIGDSFERANKTGTDPFYKE